LGKANALSSTERERRADEQLRDFVAPPRRTAIFLVGVAAALLVAVAVTVTVWALTRTTVPPPPTASVSPPPPTTPPPSDHAALPAERRAESHAETEPVQPATSNAEPDARRKHSASKKARAKASKVNPLALPSFEE
jgi:hypothetical protein